MTISKRSFLGSVAFSATALAFPQIASARIFENFFGSAIRGYDPVAYFKVSQPVKGKTEFSLEHAGSTWYFANQENLDDFKANPEKFMPAYGGHCAYAMAKGEFASIIPEAWDIVDGRLFLNYSLGVRERWRRDIPGYIQAGDAEWPKAIAR